MTFIERITLAFKLVNRIDLIEGIVTKIEGLGKVLDRLESIESKLSGNQSLETLASRIEALDAAVRKVETLSLATPEAPKQNGATVHPVKQDLIEWNRLKLLTKFVALADKGKEIEQEWQRIQQDEHDFQFAFQSNPNEQTQANYVFKKGIAIGVKWCVERFS